MTEEASGVKISEGDWKSLNNRLEAIDKSLKTTTTTITDQGKQIAKQATVVPNIVQIRMNQYNNYDTVTLTAATIPLDDTVPQYNEGKKFMDIMIKPTNAKNWLIIEALAMFDINYVGYNGIMTLFRDDGPNAICVATTCVQAANKTTEVYLKYKMLSNTTNETSFKINLGINYTSLTLTFNGNTGARLFGDTAKSYIQVTEVLEAATIDATVK